MTGLDDLFAAGRDPADFPVTPIRPYVEVNREELHTQVDKSWSALKDVAFVYGSRLAYEERGRLVAYEHATLKTDLSKHVDFARVTATSLYPAEPPKAVVSELLARDGSTRPGARQVEQITDVPIVVPTVDGQTKILTEPGWDPYSRVLYLPSPGMEGVAPGPVVEVEDIESAKSVLLDDLLGDFRFASEASKAYALAMLLLPFVRPLIAGPTPLHAVVADVPDSGKGTLVDVLCTPACGGSIGRMTPKRSEEEWDKAVLAALIDGSPVVFIDNISGALKNTALMVALTTTKYTGRLLGQTKMIEVPVRCAWAGTGNKMTLDREMGRRVVRIKIARNQPPGGFRHPNIEEWARQNRRVLVQAALTLIEHWRLGDAGVTEDNAFVRSDLAREAYGEPAGFRLSPHRGRETLRSFFDWSDVLGGVLAACGVQGFLVDRDDMSSLDDRTIEAIAFAREWAERLPSKPRLAKDLIDDLKDAFPPSLSEDDRGKPLPVTPLRLAMYLTKWSEEDLDGLCIRSESARSNQKFWRVDPTAG